MDQQTPIRNMGQKNVEKQFAEALEGFKTLANALNVQSKRVMTKVNLMENDLIAIMERQNAFEKNRPATTMGLFDRIRFRLKYGKQFSKKDLELPGLEGEKNE